MLDLVLEVKHVACLVTTDLLPKEKKMIVRSWLFGCWKYIGLTRIPAILASYNDEPWMLEKSRSILACAFSATALDGGRYLLGSSAIVVASLEIYGLRH
jgi:hypothetical protein